MEVVAPLVANSKLNRLEVMREMSSGRLCEEIPSAEAENACLIFDCILRQLGSEVRFSLATLME